ncbi:hypothetical protein CSA80_04025 [Candidatus Saccharibacteria bacterium]|nr:MAG: hypothetical protein CR973_00060 [Candidatus Saccharibacteria bacterium]PID98848.1 MAG: hypothetical protein CSA80_04025 [Candidatus Saccharibacteria bacterium]
MKHAVPITKTHYVEAGFTLPAVLSFILVMGVIATTLMTVVMGNLLSSGAIIERRQALHIAEAGVNYYLWHMAHNPTDYKDGNTAPATPDPQLGYGPYVHDYVDANARKEGTYTLWVQPQSNGSTVATVRSKGTTNGGVSRTVEARIGASSFASYGLLADVEFWFGSSEAANGPVFSNQGVHMDGPNSDTVGSANASYVPTYSYGGDGTVKDGVWCSPSVTDPDCSTRDKSNWLYPQPSIDFNQVTSALCKMKKVAFADDAATAAYAMNTDACSLTPATRSDAYIPRYSSSFSSRRGYYIQLNPDSTYDLYRVSNENDRQTDYTTALTRSVVQVGVPLPPSGVIFVEDNVWVRTSASFPGRVSIASGRLGNNAHSTDINIVGEILYSTKNGQDAIGLVSEGDIFIAPYAIPQTGAFTFEIDAATLAQSGSVRYPSTYKVNSWRCTPGWTAPNQEFLYYGSVATRQYWTWNYRRGGYCADSAYDPATGYYISGVKQTTTEYDYHLYYAPPPSYPVTGGYEILNWREVVTTP